MKTVEIINMLIELTNNDKKVMLDVLQHGQTLLELGLTNNDIEAIECAYDFILNLKE